MAGLDAGARRPIVPPRIIDMPVCKTASEEGGEDSE